MVAPRFGQGYRTSDIRLIRRSKEGSRDPENPCPLIASTAGMNVILLSSPPEIGPSESVHTTSRQSYS